MLNFRRVTVSILSVLTFSAGHAAQAPAPAPNPILEGNLPLEPLTMHRAIDLALTNYLDARHARVDIKVAHAQMRIETAAFDPVFSVSATRTSIHHPDTTSNLTSIEGLTQLALQQQQIGAIQQNTAALNENSASRDANTLAIEQNTRAVQIASGQPVGPAPTPRPATPPVETPEPSLNSRSIVVFEQDQDRVEASLQGKTPIGTRFALIAREDKTRSTFAGDPRTIVPFYEAFGGIEIRQPLLKDFGPAANLRGVRAARITERLQEIKWEGQVQEGVSTVMSLYFDMLAYFSNLAVKQEAIAANERLVQGNQRRYDLGFMSPFDVQQAKAALSEGHEQLIVTKHNYLENQFKLQRVILADAKTEANRIFYPINVPPLPVPKLSRSELLAMAYAHRPDYLGKVAAAEIQDINLRFARNQLWPQLDVIATYGYNGLAFDAAEARGQAARSQAPQWTLGLQFSMPLGNIQARAQLDLVKAQKEGAIIDIKASELQVSIDVDTVMSRIETAQQELRTARQTRELDEEALRIAERRLEEGQISSFDMIETQRRLYDAKTRELLVQAELNKAIVAMWVVTGTILEKTNVHIVANHATLTRSQGNFDRSK